MTTGEPDVASVFRVLSDANVQFVVVGDPVAGSPLTLVISRHPTNLEALGRALDRLETSVRVDPSSPEASGFEAPGSGPSGSGPSGSEPSGSEPGTEGDPPRRVGDPMGTIAVTTSGGDLDLLFGGPRRSLYTEALSHAQEREVAGLHVQWTDSLPPQEPAPRATSRMLGRRLLSLAEGLAHLIDRQDESMDGEQETDG